MADGVVCLGSSKRTIWTLLKDAVFYQVRVSNWDNVACRESRIFYHCGRIYGFNLTSVFTFYSLKKLSSVCIGTKLRARSHAFLHRGRIYCTHISFTLVHFSSDAAFVVRQS